MSEKEELIQYITNYDVSKESMMRNRMGCSENWYNPYYCIKNTFTIDEIKDMSEKEVSNLLKLAETIGDALY